jgi:hypothetical protein
MYTCCRHQWLKCLVKTCKLDTNQKDECAVLLKDCRLVCTKCARIDSFISGSVALYLFCELFSGSNVLENVLETTQQQLHKLLTAVVPGFKSTKTTLLFSSLKHGANAQAFHARCDGQGRTLTLVKDADNNVFGGFTSQSWTSTAWEWVEDTAACLIRVTSPHGEAPVVFPAAPESRQSIVCSVQYGPTFGSGMCINGNFDNECITCVDNEAYINTTNTHGYKVMTGNRQFKPIVVEVYRV